MTTRLLATLALVVAPGLARPDDPAPQAPQATVLRGRVTDKAGTKGPLPGVRVKVAVPATNMIFLDENKPHLVLETRSDAEGNYRLEIPGIVEKTKVSIDAMMPGFRRLAGTLMARDEDIELTPGRESVADFALRAARYYAGTLVDKLGRPIPGAQVNAYLIIGPGIARIEETRTGPDGAFELFNYHANSKAFGGQLGKGMVSFEHPDHVSDLFEGLDATEPEARGNLRIVLPTGHKLSGTLLDSAGKPVPRAIVEASLANPDRVQVGDGKHRKAATTDAEGHFTLNGLAPGPSTFKAHAMAIKQKIALPMVVAADKLDLAVRLEPIVIPANLKRYEVLGMQLVDVTPELKSAYDLHQHRGALILDPGPDPGRLEIGEIAQGNLFSGVGESQIDTVRDFVTRLLAETGGRDAEVHSIRVVYSFKTTDFVGTNTQPMKLTRDDIRQLRGDRRPDGRPPEINRVESSKNGGPPDQPTTNDVPPTSDKGSIHADPTPDRPDRRPLARHDGGHPGRRPRPEGPAGHRPPRPGDGQGRHQGPPARRPGQGRRAGRRHAVHRREQTPPRPGGPDRTPRGTTAWNSPGSSRRPRSRWTR